jgi:hypothetical protein
MAAAILSDRGANCVSTMNTGVRTGEHPDRSALALERVEVAGQLGRLDLDRAEILLSLSEADRGGAANASEAHAMRNLRFFIVTAPFPGYLIAGDRHDPHLLGCGSRPLGAPAGPQDGCRRREAPQLPDRLLGRGCRTGTEWRRFETRGTLNETLTRQVRRGYRPARLH